MKEKKSESNESCVGDYGYICQICSEPIKKEDPTAHTDRGLAHAECTFEPNESCAGDRLKPCPFCGGYPQSNEIDDVCEIRCEKCGARTDWQASETTATNAWNRRAPEQTNAGIWHVDAEYYEKLKANVQKMREALEEIAKGKGEYDHDPFIHAQNTIDDMKELARAALSEQ